MNTKEKGDISQAIITAEFLLAGFLVLNPIGDRHRFDMVIDRGNGFERVQCKTGRIKGGVIRFNTCSTYGHRGGGRKDYRGQIEIFAVYCPDNRKCYLIPVLDVAKTSGTIRIVYSKNSQAKKVKMAEEYEFSAK